MSKCFQLLPTVGILLTQHGEVTLLQSFVEEQHSSVDVQVEPGAVDRWSVLVRPALIEMRPL